MYYVGIDIGGTNIAVGIVNDEGKIIAKGNVETPYMAPVDVFIDAIVESTNIALANANLTIDDIKSIGLGCPGTINPETGVIEFANNLGFSNVPLRDLLNERFPGLEICMDNDANAAAFGEFKAGALKGARHALAITLGTGLGGGIIIDGKIYSGFNYAGGELGHTILVIDGRPCNCGLNGCVERYCSATGLITTTKEYMEKDKDSKMWELVKGDINKVNGRTAFDGMRAGDASATAAVNEFIKYLGAAVVNYVNIFQPEIFCIGGGICNEGETLMKPLRDILDSAHYSKNSEKQTILCRAALGNDAGIIGAALLCLQGQ